MGQGIQCHSPQESTRRITKTIGHPGVSGLVDTQREEDHEDVYDDPREVDALKIHERDDNTGKRLEI